MKKILAIFLVICSVSFLAGRELCLAQENSNKETPELITSNIDKNTPPQKSEDSTKKIRVSHHGLTKLTVAIEALGAKLDKITLAIQDLEGTQKEKKTDRDKKEKTKPEKSKETKTVKEEIKKVLDLLKGIVTEEQIIKLLPVIIKAILLVI